jgi:hypothetical protein
MSAAPAIASTRHKWGERQPLQYRTERHCLRCGMVRATIHQSIHEQPWDEWWLDGAQIKSEQRPPCNGRYDPALKVAADIPPLLHELALGDKTSTKLASVITGLITEGAILGALDPIEVRQLDGSLKPRSAFPREWLERIQRALDVGAFERLTVKQIVEKILMPPLPASADGAEAAHS